jgi:hypothetical protein
MGKTKNSNKQVMAVAGEVQVERQYLVGDEVMP